VVVELGRLVEFMLQYLQRLNCAGLHLIFVAKWLAALAEFAELLGLTSFL
jgi:hypothetical protein